MEFFGRLHQISFQYLRELSITHGGKGMAGANLRMAWFRIISCTLQRMHAISFKRNLAIAREEMKPSKTHLYNLDDIGYVNVGSSFFWKDSD